MKVFKYIFKQKVIITFTIILLLIESLCTFVTPYISSLVIDYGAQQNGMVYGAPFAVDPFSYRFCCRIIDDEDLPIELNCYDEVHVDYDLFKGDQEHMYYRANILSFLYSNKLEIINLPIMAYLNEKGDEKGSFLDKYGAVDVSNISKEEFSKIKAEIKNCADSYTAEEKYHSMVLNKAEEYEFLHIDEQWYRIYFIGFVTIIMITVVLIYLAATITGTYLASKISYNISKDLRKKQFLKVMSFSSQDMDKFSKASLITRATNDLQVVQNASVFVLRTLLVAPVMLIVGVVMSFITAPSLVWLIGLAVVFILVLALILISIVIPKYKLVQKLIDKVNSIARESISGIPIIRALNNEAFQESRFTKVNKQLYSTMLFAFSLFAIATPILMLTINILSISILWVGSFSLQAGDVNIGDLIAFISYSAETIFAFVAIAAGFIMLPRADVSIGRIEEVLNHKLQIDNYKTITKKMKGKLDNDEYIKFENVSFGYKGSKNQLFSNINFTIKKNSINAIVGPTGSGKSTILKLINRFYDVSAGNIIIEGINVKDYKDQDLRNKISYVPQKIIVFEGTLKQNVALNPKVKDEKFIEDCLRFTNLGSFIDQNKEGIDYLVKERGSNLSGGQKQRLTIARAISENSQILLLDDPFSALDANTEKKINDGLRNQFNDSTIIIVTQRLSSAVNYDNIIFMDEGKVVCSGTHEELLKSNQKYKHVFQDHFSSLIKEVK